MNIYKSKLRSFYKIPNTFTDNSKFINFRIEPNSISSIIGSRENMSFHKLILTYKTNIEEDK